MMNKPNPCDHLVPSEANRAINIAANPHKSKMDHLVYLISSVRENNSPQSKTVKEKGKK